MKANRNLKIAGSPFKIVWTHSPIFMNVSVSVRTELINYFNNQSIFRSYTDTLDKILEVPELRSDWEKWNTCQNTLSTNFLMLCRKLKIPVLEVEDVPIFGVENICLALQLEIAIKANASENISFFSSSRVKGWYWTKFSKTHQEYILALKSLSRSDIKSEFCQTQMQKVFKRIEELVSVNALMNLLFSLDSVK